MNKYNTKYLFLAHQGDDLIETILMKIVRGSNLEGYAGIKEISYNHKYYIIRPLINYNKDDIIGYNVTIKVKDKANLENFIESLNMLPFVKKVELED